MTDKPYVYENEMTHFDFEGALKRPFPFSTGSISTVSENYLAILGIIKNFDFRQSHKIIDMGAGWGNTTEMFVRLGHKVTALDVNEKFCDLIHARLSPFKFDFSVHNGDFFSVQNIEMHDVALFFESFHHCVDHYNLCKILHNVMSDEAVLLFAGEPISTSYSQPWGLRGDGMAVWSIRKFGWMELFFSENYFSQMLFRAGWIPEKLEGYLSNIVYRAKKKGVFSPGSVMWPSSANWAEPEVASGSAGRYTTSETKIILPGKYSKLELINYRPFPLNVVINGENKRFDSGENYNIEIKNNDEIQITSETWFPKLEICNGDLRELGVFVEKIEVG